MKKILLTVALLGITLTFISCGGTTQASRDQIATAHDDAKQMLHRTHTTPIHSDTIKH